MNYIIITFRRTEKFNIDLRLKGVEPFNIDLMSC